jgi:hypothetical protein
MLYMLVPQATHFSHNRTLAKYVCTAEKKDNSASNGDLQLWHYLKTYLLSTIYRGHNITIIYTRGIIITYPNEQRNFNYNSRLILEFLQKINSAKCNWQRILQELCSKISFS